MHFVFLGQGQGSGRTDFSGSKDWGLRRLPEGVRPDLCDRVRDANELRNRTREHPVKEVLGPIFGDVLRGRVGGGPSVETLRDTKVRQTLYSCLYPYPGSKLRVSSCILTFGTVYDS